MKKKTLIKLLGVISLLVVLVVATLLSACAAPATTTTTTSTTSTTTTAATGPIKIGLLMPQTGMWSISGLTAIDGFKLGMEQAGYQVAGRPIELKLYDETMDPAAGMDAARTLVEADKVDIMVGPFNLNIRLPILPYTSGKKVPNIAIVCGSPDEAKYPYVYSPTQNVFSQVVPLGWYAYDELHAKNVITIAMEAVVGHQFMQGFQRGFVKDRGGQVIQEQYFPVTTADFSSYVVNMKQADAVVGLVGQPESFITEMYKAGVLAKMPYLEVGATIMTQTLQQTGPMLINHEYSLREYAESSTSAVNTKFRADYKAKYGKEADFGAASGFGRALIILAALKATNGNTNPDVFHEAIKAVSVDTPQGVTSFTKGNADKSGVTGIITPFIENLKLVNGQYQWNVLKQYPATEPVFP